MKAANLRSVHYEKHFHSPLFLKVRLRRKEKRRKRNELAWQIRKT